MRHISVYGPVVLLVSLGVGAAALSLVCFLGWGPACLDGLVLWEAIIFGPWAFVAMAILLLTMAKREEQWQRHRELPRGSSKSGRQRRWS